MFFFESTALPTCLDQVECLTNSTTSSHEPPTASTKAWPSEVTGIRERHLWITWWGIKKTRMWRCSLSLERCVSTCLFIVWKQLSYEIMILFLALCSTILSSKGDHQLGKDEIIQLTQKNIQKGGSKGGQWCGRFKRIVNDWPTWLAQAVERRIAVREGKGSNPR